MQVFSPRPSTLRNLAIAAAIGAPLLLGGCVVEPNPYYQNSYVYPDGSAVYAAPAPYYYPAPVYAEPSVYIGGGCCYGGGWHRGGGWRR